MHLAVHVERRCSDAPLQAALQSELLDQAEESPVAAKHVVVEPLHVVSVSLDACEGTAEVGPGLEKLHVELH